MNYEERRRTFPLKFRPKESVRMESQDVIRNPTQVEAIQKIIQAMIDKANCSLGTSYKLLKGCIPHRLKPEMLDLGLKPNDTLESLFDLEHLQNKIVEDLTNKFEDTLPAHLKLERSNESDDLESKEVKNEALFEEQSKRKQETYVSLQFLSNHLPHMHIFR